MRKETQVQKEILKFLQSKGVFCWRVNNTGIPDPRCKGGWRKPTGYSMPGMSDIIGIWKGKFLAIEVKAPGREKNVSESQQEFLDKVVAEGGVALVASDIDVVKLFLGL